MQPDAQTTAEDLIAGVDLTGKLAVVTGASAGIGREAARVLAKAGATVVIGARRIEPLEALAADPETGGRIIPHRLDLASEDSVLAFANAVKALNRPVDLLINNAGVMALPLDRSVRGIESQFNINFIGHAILTSALAGLLRKAGKSRLVSLTSMGHQLSPVVFDDISFEQRPYDMWQAYGQSKTACSLLAVKVQAALGADGVSAFAVHPGIVPGTELASHLVPADFTATARRRAELKVERVTKSNAAGAATTIWAALAPELEGKGPLYLEDCRIAERIDEPNLYSGVLPHALDPDAADRLWREAERLIGRPLPL